MAPPRSINDVQKLVGWVATLNKFVSKSMDKCLPFFKVLQKVENSNDECDRAFKSLKQYFASSPMFSQSDLGEVLILYLSVSQHAVSALLELDMKGS